MITRRNVEKAPGFRCATGDSRFLICTINFCIYAFLLLSPFHSSLYYSCVFFNASNNNNPPEDSFDEPLKKKKRENKRTVTLSFFSWRYSIRNLPNSQREAQKTSVVISLASECALPCGSIIIPEIL